MISYAKTSQLGPKKRKNRGAKTAQTLHQEFEDKEIYYCEICKLEHVGKISLLGVLDWFKIDPAHRHNRDDYKNNQELLWHFNQVIRACRKHHDYIDSHHDVREKIFFILRGKDLLTP